jgi:hypothetical protein
MRPTRPGHATADARFMNGLTAPAPTYSPIAFGSGGRLADFANLDAPNLVALLAKAHRMM